MKLACSLITDNHLFLSAHLRRLKKFCMREVENVECVECTTHTHTQHDLRGWQKCLFTYMDALMQMDSPAMVIVADEAPQDV